MSEGCGEVWSRYFAGKCPAGLTLPAERLWIDSTLRYAVSSSTEEDTRDLRVLLAGGWDNQRWLECIRTDVLPLLRKHSGV